MSNEESDALLTVLTRIAVALEKQTEWLLAITRNEKRIGMTADEVQAELARDAAKRKEQAV